MTRSSPAVQRVVSILNFFADHPGQAFTLTDLVRALRLSRATCHALLAGLVEAEYLYRFSDKSYILGPALAAAAKAADAGLLPLQVAQPEMRMLADKYDATCSAAFREADEVSIRERATSVSNLGYSMPRGTRLPLRPPLAGIFFAWEKPRAVQKWLADLDPPASEERCRLMQEAMVLAREHGFTFGIENEVPETQGNEWLYSDLVARQPVLQGVDLVDDKDYRVASIMAPVFDPSGGVAFVLTLIGLNVTVPGRDLAKMGAELRQACDRHGRHRRAGAAALSGCATPPGERTVRCSACTSGAALPPSCRQRSCRRTRPVRDRAWRHRPCATRSPTASFRPPRSP